jgi:RND family efflux transporter MFP subunit
MIDVKKKLERKLADAENLLKQENEKTNKGGIKKLLKRKKVMVIAIILIVVIFAGFNVLGARKPATDMQAAANVLTVETATVKLTNSIGGLTYKANLEPAEEATVSCNVSGQVTQVVFENGDRVTQGQALAYIDDTDLQSQLKTARLDLNKLQLELDSAKSDYDIASQLYAEDACSKTSYDDAMRSYKTVLANVELKKVDIQDITNSLNDCVMKSPITGEVGEKNITVGQYLNPGTVIGSVKNSGTIKAEIQLKQEDLEKVTVGQEVTLKLSDNDTVSYKGVVETIAAAANSQTRVFDCLIKIDNTAGTLNSGVFGYIEIANKDKKQVLAVPMKAVTGSEGAYSVFKLEDGTAHKTTVEIGEITDEMVEINSGLKEGDTIITTNLNSLQDGDKVTAEGENPASVQEGTPGADAPANGEGV